MLRRGYLVKLRFKMLVNGYNVAYNRETVAELSVETLRMALARYSLRHFNRLSTLFVIIFTM